MHCQSEGMILFGGEYVAVDTEAPTVIQDVYLFSPDNNWIKNLGKSAKVKYGPKQVDNTRYQSKEIPAIEAIQKTS